MARADDFTRLTITQRIVDIVNEAHYKIRGKYVYTRLDNAPQLGKVFKRLFGERKINNNKEEPTTMTNGKTDVNLDERFRDTAT